MTLPGPLIRVPKAHQIRIEQDGPRVKLLLDGRLVFDAEWEEALRVGQGIVTRAMAAKAARAGPLLTTGRRAPKV